MKKGNKKPSGKRKKLNRKGFTLIELLAVIAVLSLVFSIALYSITSIIKNAKQKTYDTTINEIEKAAGNYAIEKDDINFVPLPSDNTKEYRCVKVNDLIEYGFLDKNVKDSLVADDKYVDVDAFVYIVRDPNNKTILNKEYVEADNDICINNAYVTGSIKLFASPDWNEWAKKKTITVKYNVNNTWVNNSNYVFSYYYQNSDDNTINPRNNNVNTKQEQFVVTKTGGVHAQIWSNSEDGAIATAYQDVNNIDSTGPVVSLASNTDTPKYVEESTSIRIKVVDCNDNNCSGVQDITSRDALDKIVADGKVKAGVVTDSDTNTIEYLPNSSVKLSYVSPGRYDVKITNKLLNGKVVIEFASGIFSDKVLGEDKNTNESVTLRPNILFDNVNLKIQVNNTNTAFANSQTATLVCRDNNDGIRYYFGDSRPTASDYVSVANTKDSGEYVLSVDFNITESKKYYFSCKDAGNKTWTVELNYWKYNVKSYLSEPEGDEGTYTTGNYKMVQSGYYLGADGMYIPFASLLLENERAKNYIGYGSSVNKYRGYSTGEPGSSNSASTVYSDARLGSNITYCLWFDRNKVNISYNTNGGNLVSSNEAYTAEENGTILKDGNSIIQTVKYGGRLGDNGLFNWNNPKHINVEREGFVADYYSWICKEGCDQVDKELAQDVNYYSTALCDASKNDCYISLSVNWQLLKYNVKFDTKGGIPSISQKNNVSYSETIEIPEVTKKVKFVPKTNPNLPSNCSNPTITPSSGKEYNLTLSGWQLGNSLLSGNKFSKLTNDPNTTVNLVAKWDVFNESLFLPTVTRSDCECGWDTKSDTNEKVYDSGGVYTGTIDPNGSAENGVITINIYPVCSRSTVREPRCYYNYQDTSDPKNGNLYYITTCENDYCNYTELNGVAQNGTIDRKNLTNDLSLCHYTIKYDCNTNGGGSNFSVTYDYTQSPNLGNKVDNKTCSKSGWTFVGWNTNKNAHTGVSSISKKPQTIYAIYKKNLTATFYDEGYGLEVPHQINVSSYTNVSFSCNNNVCTSTCTLYNKDTTCSLITPHIVFSEKNPKKNFFSSRTDDYTQWTNSGSPAGFERVYAHSAGTLSATKTYYVPHDKINDTRYNCFNYDDGNGNWRFRLNRYFVTTCDGINCNYTKKNGMDESSTTDRAGLRDSLSGSRIEKCAAEYYLIEDAKCYPQAKAVGNPSATLKVNDCKKLTAYRTTVKITSDGANSWYYYPTKDCYIEGTKLRDSAPSACNPPASSPTPSNNSSNTYYVYINGGGAICNNSSHCQNTGSYQTLKITYTGSIYISTLNSILIYDKCNLVSVGGRTLYLDWQENGLSLTAQWDCTTGNGSWCYICNQSYSWGISSYKATYPAGKAPGYCRFSSTSTNDCY